MSEPVKGKSLRLGDRFFENRDSGNLVHKPSAVWHFVLEKIVEKKNGEGIERHFVGCKYPMKGMPFEEAMLGIDIVKKYTMGFLMTFATKDMLLPFIAFWLTGKKSRTRIITNALERYQHIAGYSLSGVYLKSSYYCPVSLEIWRFVATFLREMGIGSELAHLTGKVFSTLVDYDDAYRYRIQDVMSEVDGDDMYNYPRKSVAKIAEIFEKRDKQVGFKFLAVAKILRLALLLPSIKKAWREAMLSIDFEKMQFDEADRYFCHLRTGYDFFGMTDDERIAQWVAIHEGNIPPQVEIIS